MSHLPECGSNTSSITGSMQTATVNAGDVWRLPWWARRFQMMSSWFDLATMEYHTELGDRRHKRWGMPRRPCIHLPNAADRHGLWSPAQKFFCVTCCWKYHEIEQKSGKPKFGKTCLQPLFWRTFVAFTQPCSLVKYCRATQKGTKCVLFCLPNWAIYYNKDSVWIRSGQRRVATSLGRSSGANITNPGALSRWRSVCSMHRKSRSPAYCSLFEMAGTSCPPVRINVSRQSARSLLVLCNIRLWWASSFLFVR